MSKVHTTTVIRSRIEKGYLTLVVSVDPFGPSPSVHHQQYKMHDNGKTSLIFDSLYRLEATAVEAFERLQGESA